MKKIGCCLLAVFLGMGALAGCAQNITGEAKKREALAAFQEAEMSAFEVTAAHSSETMMQSEGGTVMNADTRALTAYAYRENGAVYGDVYRDMSYCSMVDDRTFDEYSVSFARGENVYSASGSWTDSHAEAGDFNALLKEYTTSAKPLKREAGDVFDVGAQDVSAYAVLGKVAEGKVYRDGKGYRIEYDVVKAMEKVMEKLEDAAGFYAENPNCTLSKLFEAAGMNGLDGWLFGENKYGKIPAETYFSSPWGFAAALKEAKEDPERFLLEKAYGFRGAAGDKGSLNYTLTAKLSEGLALTELNIARRASVKQSYDDSTMRTGKLESAVTIRALGENPKLRDLTGMSANLGGFPEAGTYPLEKDEYAYLYYEGGVLGRDYVRGTVEGNAVVASDGIATITLTFTPLDGSAGKTETVTVNLTELELYRSREWTVFTEFTVKKDGEPVAERTDGLKLSLTSLYGIYSVYVNNSQAASIAATEKIVTL